MKRTAKAVLLLIPKMEAIAPRVGIPIPLFELVNFATIRKGVGLDISPGMWQVLIAGVIR